MRGFVRIVLPLVALLAGPVAPGADGAGGPAIPDAATSDPCVALPDLVEDALGVPVERLEVAPADPPSGLGAPRCRLRAEGTGERPGPFVDVALRLADRLRARDWREDPSYAADGPTGTRSAYRREGTALLVSVDGVPADPDACPDDAPIYWCPVPPERQRVTVVVDVFGT